MRHATSCIWAATLVALPLIAACASTGVENRYQTELDALEARCTARQGILVTTGLQTGRPETDYACRISGVASRIPGD